MRTVDDKVVVALHQIRDAIKNKDCCNGGGNTPSGDITIDDVVKFIHDDLANSPAASIFPYTTWDSIPNYNDVENGICKGTTEDRFSETILNLPLYTIGLKGKPFS